jgi:hypothetical protein
MIAFKLLRQRPDGSISPLFINATQRIPIGVWLEAEDHPTKGYAHRPGWHCTLKPIAPHLKMNPKGGMPRVWCRIEVEDVREFDRPQSQGGTWVLANRMKVLRII